MVAGSGDPGELEGKMGRSEVLQHSAHMDMGQKPGKPLAGWSFADFLDPQFVYCSLWTVLVLNGNECYRAIGAWLFLDVGRDCTWTFSTEEDTERYAKLAILLRLPVENSPCSKEMQRLIAWMLRQSCLDRRQGTT